MNNRRRTDHGFSLIELLITIAILGIVLVPLSGLVLSYFKDTTATSARLYESHDAQIAATYFAQDIASVGTRMSTDPSSALAQSVWTNVTNGSQKYPCGSTGTALVLLVADDSSGASAPPANITLGYNRVAYTLQVSSGQTQLHRIGCLGSATIVTDTVIAHQVDATTPPTIACDVSCAGSGPSVPQKISLTLALKAPGNTSADYVFTLTGQRRTT